jgi:hypothetical protein
MTKLELDTLLHNLSAAVADEGVPLGVKNHDRVRRKVTDAAHKCLKILAERLTANPLASGPAAETPPAPGTNVTTALRKTARRLALQYDRGYVEAAILSVSTVATAFNMLADEIERTIDGRK